VRRIHDHPGLSARHLTISTVGIVPGIDRLAGEDLPVNLAVSLHAANDALRDELVPVNRRYPLEALTAACRRYLAATGRRLSFEWALIDATNDRPSDAAELAALARSLRAHVNLIPLNPTPGYATPGTPPAGVRGFRDRLRALGVNVTVRRNRGTAIDAACGQLRADHAACGQLRADHAYCGQLRADQLKPSQRARTVSVAPTRTESTSTSPGRTTPPGHTTERTSVPSTTAPGPTTGSPPDTARLASR
jgi:hypothetical protein